MNFVSKRQTPSNANYYLPNKFMPERKHSEEMLQRKENPSFIHDLVTQPNEPQETYSVLVPPLPDSFPIENSPSVSSTKYVVNAGSNKKYFRCQDCKLWLTSQETLDIHLSGSKHARKIQELELSEFGKKLPKYILSEEANTFKCTLCNIFATSLLQVKSHVDGAKHKNKVKNISQEKDVSKKSMIKIQKQQSTTIILPESVHNVANKNSQFYCSTCNKCSNSQTQFDQHMNSRKHISKFAAVAQGNTTERPQKRKYTFTDTNSLKSYFIPEKRISDIPIIDAFDLSIN